jgi:hypothetical protein
MAGLENPTYRVWCSKGGRVNAGFGMTMFEKYK